MQNSPLNPMDSRPGETTKSEKTLKKGAESKEGIPRPSEPASTNKDFSQLMKEREQPNPRKEPSPYALAAATEKKKEGSPLPLMRRDAEAHRKEMHPTKKTSPVQKENHSVKKGLHPSQKTKKTAEEASQDENPLAALPLMDEKEKNLPPQQEKTPQPVVASLEAVAATTGAENRVQGSAPVQISPEVLEIVEQMAERISVMESEGVSKTTLTLRNSALFEGATITLSETDTAQGEFNIDFANLSSDAKDFLDNMGARERIMEAMEQKGFTVHILQTTQLSDEALAQTEEGFQDTMRDSHSDDGEQEQRRHQHAEEDEEEA